MKKIINIPMILVLTIVSLVTQSLRTAEIPYRYTWELILYNSSNKPVEICDLGTVYVKPEGDIYLETKIPGRDHRVSVAGTAVRVKDFFKESFTTIQPNNSITTKVMFDGRASIDHLGLGYVAMFTGICVGKEQVLLSKFVSTIRDLNKGKQGTLYLDAGKQVADLKWK